MTYTLGFATSGDTSLEVMMLDLQLSVYINALSSYFLVSVILQCNRDTYSDFN